MSLNPLTSILNELVNLPIAEIPFGVEPEPFGISMKGKTRPEYHRINGYGLIWLEIYTNNDYIAFKCDNHKDNLLIINTFLKYLFSPLGLMHRGGFTSFRPEPNVFISRRYGVDNHE